MTWVSSAIGAVGGAIGGLGGKLAASSQANALEYGANLKDENAGIALDQARADEKTIQKNIYRQVGAQRAAAGASGIGMDGSILDVIDESNREGAVDVQRRQYAADLEARSHHIDADLDRYYGRVARKAGTMVAVSGGVGAVGKAYGSLSESSTAKK
jgi:hypothetical protein